MGIYKVLYHSLEKRICLFLLLFFAPILSFYGQNPDINFKHLTTEDGLSDGTINAIYQDKSGFMWFGTDFGLNKYDGYKFTSFKLDPTDSNSLAINLVSDIFEDSYGNFWVAGGYKGLDLFDRNKLVFTHFVHDNNDSTTIGSDYIRAVYEDSHKNLWIGTSGGGLDLYDHNNKVFSHILRNHDDPNSIGSNYISSIAEDSHGILWLGTTEGFLIKFDPVKRSFKNFRVVPDFKGDQFSTIFGKVYIDSDDDVWFGTETGLYVYHQKTGEFTHYQKENSGNSLTSNSVTSVIELKKCIMLITTDHGGLNILNKKTGKFSYLKNDEHDENTISNDQLYSSYRSDDGVIWIGSYHGGVNIYDSKAIKFRQGTYKFEGGVASINNKSIISIDGDDNGKIWLGSDGQGIYIYDPATDIIKRFRPNDQNPYVFDNLAIVNIDIDKDNVWIGTYLEGLWLYNKKNKTLRHFTKELGNTINLPGNVVWSTLRKNDTVLIGTFGYGIDMFDTINDTFKNYMNNPDSPESMCYNSIYKLFEDSHHNIWAGTRFGLSLFDAEKGTFKNYNSLSKNNSLYGKWVLDIFQDSNGSLWVGTDLALNLYLPDSDKFVHFLDNLNSPEIAIHSIMEDNRHNLWLGTNNGLIKFNTNDKSYRIYDVSDGLPGNEFNFRSAFTSHDGKMYFGNKKGFIAFYPDSIIDNPEIPPVFFTDLKIFNKSVDFKSPDSLLKENINYIKEITLSYKQSVISFEFSALNYTNSVKNQYAYELEGFDKTWNYIGTKREVTYTNLNPGRYVLHIKGSNNNGVWNETGTSVILNITPPFWKTIWFYFIELFTAIILIYLFIFFRERRLVHDKRLLQNKVQERTLKIEQQKGELEKHRNHLEKLVENRTKELKIAKEKAEESDRLKTAFLANMSHEIRTPMNAIMGFSNLLDNPRISDENRRNFISYINSNTESLLVLIQDILDLSLIEANQLNSERKNFEVNELVDYVHSTTSVNNKNSNIEVKLNNTLKDQSLVINSDQFRIRQVLLNLMSNALKFTETGYVELGLLKENDNLVFYVKDTGPGISQKEMELIFERFRKTEFKSGVDKRGAGLGLAISKSLAVILDGELSVESDGKNGSTFFFSLPFKQVVTGEKIPEKRTENVTVNDWRDKEILIVEPDNEGYRILENALKNSGISITRTNNGNEARDILKQNNYDLILMDVSQLQADGFETAKVISNEKNGQVIIALITYTGPKDEEKIKKNGFDDYLTKPVKPFNLYSVLSKYL